MKEIKLVKLTVPQMIFDMAPQPKKYFEGGRGAGKTTLLGKRMRDLVANLPRAAHILVGSTYSQMLGRTLPSAIEGLEMFGIYKDVDYVVGQCGKKFGFEMPHQPPSGPLGWKNIIHFSNGAIFPLVSLDNPDSGRGFNAISITSDESAIQDEEKLYINVKATNRVAKYEIYGKNRFIGSESYYSSTPLTKKGKWFTDMEDKAKKNPDKYFFLKASAKSNPYLRKEWFEEMREEAISETIYNAEILNIRPKEITNGFYANLIPEKHYYTDFNNSYLIENTSSLKPEHFTCNQDNDIDLNEPLIVSLDFGVFNCCVVSQANDIEYNVLNSFHVKSPKLLDDLFLEKFIPYYKPHINKTIMLYGGHDGNNRLPNSSKTLFEQVISLLRLNGWTVILMTKGAAATHFDKYLLVNAMLKGHPKLPKIRINEHNNPDLIISLERAEAKESTNGVDKNKSSEKSKSILQQHATHYSDAFDVPIVTIYNAMFKGNNSFISEFSIKSS